MGCTKSATLAMAKRQIFDMSQHSRELICDMFATDFGNWTHRGRLTLWAVGFLCEDRRKGDLRGMARIRAAPTIAALIAILALGGCGDTFLPSYGPRSIDVRTHSTEPDALPYATVRLTPEVVDILASHDPRLANVFADRRPPPPSALVSETLSL